jgi:hypothetical protein
MATDQKSGHSDIGVARSVSTETATMTGNNGNAELQLLFPSIGSKTLFQKVQMRKSKARSGRCI